MLYIQTLCQHLKFIKEYIIPTTLTHLVEITSINVFINQNVNRNHNNNNKLEVIAKFCPITKRTMAGGENFRKQASNFRYI